MSDADARAVAAFNAYATARRYLTMREVIGVALPGDPGVTELDCAQFAAHFRDVWAEHLRDEPRIDPDDVHPFDSDEALAWGLIAPDAHDPDQVLAGLDRHIRAQAHDLAARIVRSLPLTPGEQR